MKLKAFLLIFALLFGFTAVNAQKTKNPVKRSSDKIVIEKLPNSEDYAEDYAIVVEIDGDLELRVLVQENSNTKSLGDTKTMILLESFFSTLSQRKIKKKLNAVIIIKPDSVLKYEEILNVIKKIRDATSQNIKVEISKNLFVLVPKALTKADLLKSPKPNPLFLMVSWDEGGNLFLNREEEGSIKDLSKLKNHLKQIFKDRGDNGVFRVGSNEVEKNISIKPPRSASFFDLTKIAEALQEAGASPIGLQIDDDFIQIERIQSIDEKPVKP